RHCLILDDVLDKGDTAARVIEVVRQFEPASISTLFMVRKKVQRTVEVQADYVLFDVDDLWLIGAGLDDKGYGRDRPHIACKRPEYLHFLTPAKRPLPRPWDPLCLPRSRCARAVRAPPAAC